MKYLALYLPQYHSIPENDSWWGNGYTEWTAVKKARPLFRGHSQPKVPLNNNYYNLADETGSVWRWQAKLANTYGIDGFCIYHYWFGTKQLLEKPMEVLLKHKDIKINYCICWANESWTKTWYGKEKDVLIKQEYGNVTDWERHFTYLLQFFLDYRYIKIDNKPMINIYRIGDIPRLNDMLTLWNELAIKNGFKGIYVVASQNSISNKPIVSNMVNAMYLFEPGYSTRNGLNIFERINYFGGIWIKHFVNRLFKKSLFERKISIKAVNKRIIRNLKNKNKNSAITVFPGICPCWDNTPRRGTKGSVYTKDQPKEFERTLRAIVSLYGDNDNVFLYINAWNEWGEGCHLEPDNKHGYAYLEAIKNVKEK